MRAELRQPEIFRAVVDDRGIVFRDRIVVPQGTEDRRQDD